MIDSHQFAAARTVHERMQAGDPVLFIDVREPAEFREMHCQGAASVPLGSVSLEKLQSLDHRWDGANHPVYLVCQSGIRALQAAEKLHQQGVRHPVVVEGGTDGWDHANLPVVRSKTMLPSLERQTQIALGALLMLILIKGAFIHPGFYLLIGLVASGLLLAGFTAKCTLTGLLARMPWNQQQKTAA